MQLSWLSLVLNQYICVVSDDTDVFILLVHFYSKENHCCKLYTESTGKEHILIDIEATVEAHPNVVSHLIAVYCISGCNTVAQFFGVGKGTALKAIHAGFIQLHQETYKFH